MDSQDLNIKKVNGVKKTVLRPVFSREARRRVPKAFGFGSPRVNNFLLRKLLSCYPHQKNRGSVYETVVASELLAHGHKLFYYDNRSKGEADYLIDDYDSLSAVPIEVKYTVHSALNTFLSNEDYHIKKAYVVSNERVVSQNGKITYIPIYYIMFF